MGKDSGADGQTVTETTDTGQIRQDIETTREHLGDTVAALSEKADVKAQAKQKVEETRTAVADKTDELLGKARQISPDAAVSAGSDVSEKVRQNPLPVAAAGAFALGFLLGRVSGH